MSRSLQQVWPSQAAPSTPPAAKAILVVLLDADQVVHVRRALWSCHDASIVRVMPRLRDTRVRIDIQCPASQAPAVIDRLWACSRNSQIERISCFVSRCGA